MNKDLKDRKQSIDWINKRIASRRKTDNYANKHKGEKRQPFSPEWCKNISQAKKGKTSPTKGIVRKPERRIEIWFYRLDQRIPRKREIADLISKNNKGKISSFKGKKHSVETIELIKKKHLGKQMSFSAKGLQNKINTCKNRVWSEESRQKLREKRKNWKIPFFDTKPEKMMQIALALNEIKFEKHKPFKLGNRWHQVDIFIEPNICVEVDGIKWHIEDKDIRRDLFQTQELTIMGYHVIRIRDKDILRNTQNCAEKVIQLIKELQHKTIDLG